MNPSTPRNRVLSAVMSLVLAIGLMPLPAYAAQSEKTPMGGGSDLTAASVEGLAVQSANAELGAQEVDGYVTIGDTTAAGSNVGTYPGISAYGNNSWLNNFTEMIYTQAEVGSTARTITSVGWYTMNTADNTLEHSSFKIYLGYTSANTIGSATDLVPASDMTLVYDHSGTVTTSSTSGGQWVDYELDNSFYYSAESGRNLVVAVIATGNNLGRVLNTANSTTANLGYFAWTDSKDAEKFADYASIVSDAGSVEKNGVAKARPSIRFGYAAASAQQAGSVSTDPTSFSLIAGGENGTAEITYNGDGALSAESSDETVATASVSGTTLTVVPVGEGNATVTVNAPATSEYTAATAALDVVVAAGSDSTGYVVNASPVTSGDDFAGGGKYIFTDQDGTVAMTESDAAFGVASVVAGEGTLSFESEEVAASATWSVAEESGSLYLKSSGGKYINHTTQLKLDTAQGIAVAFDDTTGTYKTVRSASPTTGTYYLYIQCGSTKQSFSRTLAQSATSNSLVKVWKVTPSDSGSAVHDITKADAENGSFTVSVNDDEATEAAADAKVTIMPVANEGYEVDAVAVKDADEESVTVTESEGAYTFTMPAKAVTVTVAFKKSEASSSAINVTRVSSFDQVVDGETYFIVASANDNYAYAMSKENDGTNAFRRAPVAITTDATNGTIDFGPGIDYSACEWTAIRAIDSSTFQLRASDGTSYFQLTSSAAQLSANSGNQFTKLNYDGEAIYTTPATGASKYYLICQSTQSYAFTYLTALNVNKAATIWKKTSSSTPSATHEVSFDVGGGTPVPETQSVAENGKATKPLSPTKPGYTFAGWQLNGSLYDFDTAVTGAITLTASWVEDSDAPTTVRLKLTQVTSAEDFIAGQRYVLTSRDGAYAMTGNASGIGKAQIDPAAVVAENEDFATAKYASIEDAAQSTWVAGKDGDALTLKASDGRFLTVGSVELGLASAGTDLEWDGSHATYKTVRTAGYVTTSPGSWYGFVQYNNDRFLQLAGSVSANVVIAWKAEPIAAYDVTVASGVSNGSVQVDKVSAAEGETVVITAEPDTGYEIDAVSYTPAEGSAILVEPVNGAYSFTMPARNVEVAATFKAQRATVTFVDEDGEKVLKAAQPYDYGTAWGSVDMPSNPSKEDAGGYSYEFDKWVGAPETVIEDVTVKASYVKSPIKYAIAYEGMEGATNPNATTEYTVESDDITLIAPTKDGYVFAGWTGADLAEAATSVTIGKGSTGNREYTATWIADKSSLQTAINMAESKKAGVKESGDSASLDEGDKYAPIAAFTALDEAIAAATEFLNGTDAVTAEDVAEQVNTLRAAIQAFEQEVRTVGQHTVAFAVDGGSPTVDPQAVADGHKAVKPAGSLPVKDGYALDDDWYVDANANGKWDDGEVAYDFDSAVSADVALVAKWNAISYTIAYEGGSEYKAASGSFPDAYTVEAEVSVPDAAKDGYAFDGWTYANEDDPGKGLTTPAKDVVIPQGSFGNLVFTAHFTKVLSQVSIDTEPADGVTVEVRLGSEAVTPVDGKYSLDPDGEYTITVTPDDTARYSAKSVTWTVASGTSVSVSLDKKKYTVTFYDEDGTTVLKAATEYEYGTVAADIAAPAAPSKADDDQHAYTFDGWQPALADVTADAVYKAAYKVVEKPAQPVDVDEDEGVIVGGGILDEPREAGVAYELKVENDTKDASGVVAAVAKAAASGAKIAPTEESVAAVFEVELVKHSAGADESLSEGVGALKLTFPVASVKAGDDVRVIQLHEGASGTESVVYEGGSVTVADGSVSITLDGRLSTFIVTVALSKANLEAAIAAAVADLDSTAVAASAVEVAKGAKYVTKAEHDALEAAIEAAKKADSDATTQEALDIATAAMREATAAFDAAKKDGAKSEPEEGGGKADAEVEEQVMYRLYNPNSGEHLYTADADERDALANEHGWNYEGEAWTAPKESSTPVYRLYNSHERLGDHHYTTDKDEYDYLVSIGWTGEDIAWYSDDDEGMGLYRLYNPNAYPMGLTGAHHYTTSEDERDFLVAIGWEAEGFGWYGVK